MQTPQRFYSLHYAKHQDTTAVKGTESAGMRGKNKQWNMPRGRLASGAERGASGVLDPIPQKL